MLLESRPALDPELSALVVAQQHELLEASGGVDGLVYPAHDGISYLVAVVDGRAVGCGAWRALEDGVAELKRVFVRPAFRGRGIARQLVVALEEEALAAGRAVIRVEAGAYLNAAIALYRSVGYQPIPPYGEHVGNPLSRCFEKVSSVLVEADGGAALHHW